jgi:pimeloyl-ACP methyl ester carboxylesterase
MSRTLTLELLGVEHERDVGGAEAVRLRTDAGVIHARFHDPAKGDAAVVWVGGAGGGLYGPAGGLYARLAERLVPHGIASLRLDYRRPNDLVPCVLDTLAGMAYLEGRERTRVVLVGHSFGGAVVVTAGVASERVVAVAALSSQTYGTSAVDALSPRPLLLMHGQNDQVLPDYCSRDVFRRARQPKEILLYPGCGHGLDECREQVDADLLAWLRRVLGA